MKVRWMLPKLQYAIHLKICWYSKRWFFSHEKKYWLPEKWKSCFSKVKAIHEQALAYIITVLIFICDNWITLFILLVSSFINDRYWSVHVLFCRRLSKKLCLLLLLLLLFHLMKCNKCILFVVLVAQTYSILLLF